MTLGKISNCTATILIDSGATTNFINQQFCHRNRLLLTAIVKQRVGMADNRIIMADKGLIGVYLEVFGKRARENFVAVEGLKHAAILGMPWLQHSQAIIDFEHREIAFKGGKFPKLLDVLKETNLITTEIGDEDELFNIHVRQTTEKSDTQSDKTQDANGLVQKIFCENSVTYSKKNCLIGYHREGEMIIRSFWSKGINLHPEHHPRMSPAELTELRKTIDELLKKGFIRPSSSPSVLRLLLLKRRMDSCACV